MKLVKYSLIFLCFLVIASCKNDLKLNAPYKEIPSIYAVLNPSEAIQIIRINKVFLGEGDANAMAQVADSINYPAGELTVTLDRTNEYGVVDLATPTGNKQTITFRDSVVEAKEGSFSKTQRVYVSSDKLIVTGKYHLTVKNNKTGNKFTASTAALDSITSKQIFQPLGPPYYPYLPNPSNLSYFVDYVSGNNDGGSVRFPTNSAAIYQMTIRFHFYDSLYNTQKTYNYVDYNFTTKNLKDAENGTQGLSLVYSFKKADMFSALGVGLSKMGLNDLINGRKMYKVQYLIYTSTQDYVDYMQYVTPSLSIAQNKPLYSNFDKQAALGIFTFRTRFSVNKEMATPFISAFASNPNTCKYRFYTASFGLPLCN